MNQTQFQESRAGLSQCDAILARLKQSPGAWVAMPELYRVSGAFAVHSRIADLRKRGHTISQRSHRDKQTNLVHSFYSLQPSDSANPNPSHWSSDRLPSDLSSVAPSGAKEEALCEGGSAPANPNGVPSISPGLSAEPTLGSGPEPMSNPEWVES